MSFEYHFFIDQNSYFGLFYDISHIDNKLNEKQTSPYQGFGASISFSTVAGIFKLSYALGKSPNQNIQFKNSKIHFGYSALF
jgi:outer membrane translocation and assembly module TamA